MSRTCLLYALAMAACAWIVVGAAGTSHGESSRGATTMGSFQDQEAETGADLYKFHCSGCHGITGDGKGTTKLETPARSFKEGRFAFGNTPEQLLKTITAGIPGRSKMPSFAELLDDTQKKKVIEHVLTLMPKEKKASRREMRLDVGEKAQIIRGLLPAMIDGLPERPRGLLVGIPGGMSFEYRTDDVRLLGVRKGSFVDRADWNGRGGTPIEPLGTVLFTIDDGNPGTMFQDANGNELSTRFRGTRVDGVRGVVLYDVVDANGIALASIEECCTTESVANGFGCRQSFAVTSHGDSRWSIIPSAIGSSRFKATEGIAFGEGGGGTVATPDGSAELAKHGRMVVAARLGEDVIATAAEARNATADLAGDDLKIRIAPMTGANAKSTVEIIRAIADGKSTGDLESFAKGFIE